MTPAETVLAALLHENDKLPTYRAATESELLARAIKCGPLWEVARAIVAEARS